MGLQQRRLIWPLIHMQITKERIAQIKTIFGETPMSQWQKKVGEKLITWQEWAYFCQHKDEIYAPPAQAELELDPEMKRAVEAFT